MSRFLSLMLLLWLISACSSTPQLQRYTLTDIASQTLGEPVNLAGGLGVGPIDLPEYWQQKEIIVLAEDNRVLSDSQHLWAGDPKLAISRVIATKLGQGLQINEVWAHPWDSRSKPQKQILLIIEAFGGSLGGTVELVAKWRVLDDFGAKAIATERQTFSVTSSDKSYAAYVAAMNQAINEL